MFMGVPKFERKKKESNLQKLLNDCLQLFLIYAKKSKRTYWEMKTHVGIKLWRSECWTQVMAAHTDGYTQNTARLHFIWFVLANLWKMRFTLRREPG